MKKYDIAAYVWPAYTGREPRTHIFWEEQLGEWQTVKNYDRQKYEGDSWPRKPLWGYVDEADPEVMEKEINEAVLHGVNVFIYDWYWYDGRPFLENCLNDGFLKAKNNGEMKFYLMWANHDANYTWDKRNAGITNSVVWRGCVDKDEFEKLTERVADKYFVLDNYYKTDGKPVFMIYDVANLINGLGGIEKTRVALDSFREYVRGLGFPGLHLQMAIWSPNEITLSGVDGERLSLAPEEIVRKLGFDSITHYQFVHFTNIDRDYNEILDDVMKEWNRIDSVYDVPYFPHISIGWDNNPRFKMFREGVVKNNTPENVKKGFKMAKEYADSHPDMPSLITVNSWNEWTETSYLEPDDKNGYGYLNAVKEVFIDEKN